MLPSQQPQQPGSASPPVHQSTSKADQTGPKDGDNVQAGDQSAPDNPGSKAEQVGGTDGDNVQEGDQSTPDNSAAGHSEQANSEQSGSEAETAAGNDGPGGHADEIAGNANANHQFEGNE